MVLDLITAKEGGVCVIINLTCCAYIGEMQRVEIDLQATWEQTKVLHQVSVDDASRGLTELLES